jgi:hypothetical protein
MLTAYFDDSGTHLSSDIVLVAGVFGTEWQLKSLDRLWQKHIDRPLSGPKPPIRRFHATDCYNSTICRLVANRNRLLFSRVANGDNRLWRCRLWHRYSAQRLGRNCYRRPAQEANAQVRWSRTRQVGASRRQGHPCDAEVPPKPACATPRCSSIKSETVSGGRRPKPHSVAMPKSVTTCFAAR